MNLKGFGVYLSKTFFWSLTGIPIPLSSNFNKTCVEVVEIEDHPWFVGAQFHPEYKSTVANPHPLFVGFIAAALENKS